MKNLSCSDTQKNRVKYIKIAAAVLFWLIVWQAAAAAVNKKILLVSPIAVAVRLSQLVAEPAFWQAMGFSLAGIAVGFLLAVLLGIILAALSASFEPLRILLLPLMTAIKTVPVASFIILVLIWFPSEKLSSVISFLMVLPVIYTNTQNGIMSMKKELGEMAETFRIPLYRRIGCVYIPQIMPDFRAGCEISLGLCWKSGIAAEVIGMPDGSIGEALQQAKVYLNTPDLFAWTVVIVILSAMLAKLFLFLLSILEKTVTRV